MVMKHNENAAAARVPLVSSSARSKTRRLLLLLPKLTVYFYCTKASSQGVSAWFAARLLGSDWAFFFPFLSFFSFLLFVLFYCFLFYFIYLPFLLFVLLYCCLFYYILFFLGGGGWFCFGFICFLFYIGNVALFCPLFPSARTFFPYLLRLNGVRLNLICTFLLSSLLSLIHVLPSRSQSLS